MIFNNCHNLIVPISIIEHHVNVVFQLEVHPTQFYLSFPFNQFFFSHCAFYLLRGCSRYERLMTLNTQDE